ncbi:hypothetical protein AAC387_Pa07g1300 [Persea americana]
MAEILSILSRNASLLTPSAIASLLTTCSKLRLLKTGTPVHAIILKRRDLYSDLYLLNHLLNFYAKCNQLEYAHKVFDEIPERNIVSWTSLISGYYQCGRGDSALHLFSVMNAHDPSSRPNEFTYASVVGACTKLELLAEGMQVHSQTLQRGFLSHVLVSNVFISFYMASGCVAEAEIVFQEIPEPDQVSWNSLILGLSQNGFIQTALERFQRMRELGVSITSFTLTAAITACLEDEIDGKRIHGLAIKTGLDSDCFTGSALIRMYSGFKNMEDAFKAFQMLAFKDVASWNSLIEGYGRSDQGERGLQVFIAFMESGLKADEITITSVVGICTDLVMLECGKQVHSLSLKGGLDGRIRIGNSMIDMYSKCGSLDDGLKIFQQMKEKSIVSWTAMMGGLAYHGRADEVLKLFEEMKIEGVKPNKVTYTCVLSACGHNGLVDLGQKLFRSMEIEPDFNHYMCMVHLLAGGGRFGDAEMFIRSSPAKYEELLWQSFLVACKNSGEWEKGLEVAERIIGENQSVEPLMSVVLSNVFAAAGRWEEVMKLRANMNGRGMKKEPACSWIEVDNIIQCWLTQRSVSRATKHQSHAAYIEELK